MPTKQRAQTMKLFAHPTKNMMVQGTRDIPSFISLLKLAGAGDHQRWQLDTIELTTEEWTVSIANGSQPIA